MIPRSRRSPPGASGPSSLFMVGIGSTFKLHTVRYVLISVGAVLLIFATVLIARQPGIPA